MARTKHKDLKTWLFRGEQRNAAEIAKILNISNTTVYERANRGLLDVPVDRKFQTACKERFVRELEESGVHELDRAVDLDTPYEQDAVCQRLVASNPDGMTLEAIGTSCGLTRERIRQIEADVVRRMRSLLNQTGKRGDDARNVVEMLRLRASMNRETHQERAERMAPGDVGLRGWDAKHGYKFQSNTMQRSREQLAAYRARSAKAMAGRTRKEADK